MKGTKELIQKAALKLFGKKGVKNTTMDEVAKEVRIGKGTIYHYYDSKEQLFCELLESKIAESIKVIENAVNAVSGPENRLRAYFMARFKVMGEFPKIFPTFKEEYVSFYSYIKKAESKFTDFGAQNIKRCLQEGVEKGVFEIEDIDIATFIISKAIEALEYFFALEQKTEELERKVNLGTNMVMKGLLKR
jgi:AcrR family transcriptional regulator